MSNYDGYIRRIIAKDGYAMVRPYNFLDDGYPYNIMREGSLILNAIAFRLNNNPNQVVLRPSDPSVLMTLADVGDIVVKVRS